MRSDHYTVGSFLKGAILMSTLFAFPLASAVASEGLAPLLSNEEAWSKLPRPEGGSGGPLPSWARMLAGELPRTTAAYLQLDLAQRTKSPIEPKLRAAMRWVSAEANGSKYAQAQAEADARRAGISDAAWKTLATKEFQGWTEAERAALRFARKMTLESDRVTDDEFAFLVKSFGEKQAAAMVLLMAFSNFQDRLLICLDAPIEEGGVLGPVEVSFDPSTFASKTTPPPPSRGKIPALPKPTGKDDVHDAPEWADVTYAVLQQRLEAQRQKPTRLRIPEWSEVAKNLPEGLMKKPSDIIWYRICFGYAPELAVPFEYVMRTAGAETSPKWDRIFGQGLFWVTTKAINCPYCMGHCEMNWEVAGLSKEQIAERSLVLAGDDWSSFPKAEQHAFAFARKLTKSPAGINQADIDQLKADFGADRALIVAFNASRYHYMTRISNGFQLKLERENVFYDYYNTKPPASTSRESTKEMPVELLSDDAAWKRLPAANTGAGQPLPNWAKGVAAQLPRTAAAMLNLDFAQRTKSPLDPILRAKMRWVIAHANRCVYSEDYAIADLKRAGASEQVVNTLKGNPADWPESDRAPLEFARLLTVAAPTITDELFSLLRHRHGDKGVASMVLLGAYGNFQDRIILGLNLPMEPTGPLPPLEVTFAPGAFQAVPLLPDQAAAPSLRKSGETVVDRDPEWSSLSFETLQSRLETQRARVPRLPIPRWDEVKKNLPPAVAARPTKIVWNLVCSGYVPELAIPWSIATRTMWAEAKPNRVFEESLFWIQTRSIQCNYCMGHCEMLLEAAGLDKNAVSERTKKLAGDDWSSFPPEEQRAYAYARKLTKTPWELSASDYKTIEKDLGPETAMATFWWLCRGLYMTRVSDGFQLPLERENVFIDFFGTPKEATSPK